VDLTLPTIKQSIVGGEEFAERVFKAVRKKAETNRAATLAEIEEVVCRLGKVDKEMLRRPLRSMAVKRGSMWRAIVRRQACGRLSTEWG
jgi:hypothetical protein